MAQPFVHNRRRDVRHCCYGDERRPIDAWAERVRLGSHCQPNGADVERITEYRSLAVRYGLPVVSI